MALLPVRPAAFFDVRRYERVRFQFRYFRPQLGDHPLQGITGHKDLRMLQRYNHMRVEDLAMKIGWT